MVCTKSREKLGSQVDLEFMTRPDGNSREGFTGISESVTLK